MLGDDEDVFDSVTWESAPPIREPSTSGLSGGFGPSLAEAGGASSGPGFRQSADDEDERDPNAPRWEGYMRTAVRDPTKEMAETKDAYVSYLVTAETDLPIFSTRNPSARRRYKDFVFLRDNLVKDFPACVVPPLPGKQRLEYVTGDRFSPEFMERRRQDLHRFLQRLGRHPLLQRASLLRAFFESTEWQVIMHQHVAHPPGGADDKTGVFENISDTLLNAFGRVRKPDERFLSMRDGVDKFEDGLAISERLWARIRSRTNDGDPESGEDLTADYHDLAVAVQGLGFLESGITDPLNHFSNTLLEFSALLRHVTQGTVEPYLTHLAALQQYSHANRAVLRLRDQKQMDLEELSEYLSGVTGERDRLAAAIRGVPGATGLGIGAYLRERVDALRGVDDDRARVDRMRKLDGKIKELEEAVTTAHETSDAFSAETLREQAVFQYAKEAEMKESLGALADGHIEFYKAAMEEWDRIIPLVERIRVDI